MLLNVSWQYNVHSTAWAITGGNAFHHQSKNSYGDKIKLILTCVDLETEPIYLHGETNDLRACVYFRKAKRRISFPFLAMRLGLFTLRNDPTTHASEITLLFNSVKKEVLVFQSADIFDGMFWLQRLEWISYLGSMENEMSFKVWVEYHGGCESM